jgi:hypothetical protein
VGRVRTEVRRLWRWLRRLPDRGIDYRYHYHTTYVSGLREDWYQRMGLNEHEVWKALYADLERPLWSADEQVDGQRDPQGHDDVPEPRVTDG